MSYTDTTITPASGYTYVHQGQVYVAIATALGAHAAWSLVDTVDYVNTTFTNRSYVWKCSMTYSGLPKDFYVIFQVKFTTIGTVYATNNDGWCVRMFLAEDYSAGVAGRVAKYDNGISYTLPSDNSSNVSATNVSTSPFFGAIGPTANLTSYRMFIGITNDVLFFADNTVYSGATVPETYIGVIDSVMNSTDDYMPIVIGSIHSAASYAYWVGNFSATRHPKLTPGTQTFSFGFSAANAGGNPTQWTPFGAGSMLSLTHGTLGDGVSGDLFSGGNVIVSRCGISSNNYANPTNKTNLQNGGLRGYLRHMIVCYTATHSPGDTFSVAGNAYLGLGSYYNGLWDTTA
jgi:hypothetical protein